MTHLVLARQDRREDQSRSGDQKATSTQPTGGGLH